MAALAAAHNGAEVTLVERGGFLGGGMGTVNANYIGGSCAPKLGGEQVVMRGLLERFVERLVAAGASIGFYPEGKMCDVPFNAELCKFVLDEMVVEAGIRPLFHTFVAGAVVENGVLKRAVVANKAGLSELPADMFVDATGDGDLAFFAGARYDQASLEDMMKATLIFKMGGVDFDKILAYAKDHPDEVAEASEDKIWVFGFRKLLDQAVEDAQSKGEEPPFVRGIGVIALSAFNPGEYWMLQTDVSVDGTDPYDLSRLEIEARKQVKSLLPTLKKYIPGFEDAFLSQIAPRPGIRETRRIIGEYVLTKEDILQGREFPDVVCRLCHHIDLHDNAKQGHHTIPIESPRGMYDLPYRCLVPKDIDNLLMAGRCISVTAEALGSIRIQSHCLATGQVAGTAAAMAAAKKVAPRELGVEDLQARLVEMEALVL